MIFLGLPTFSSFENVLYEYVIYSRGGGRFGVVVVGALQDWDPYNGILDANVDDEV